MISKKGSYRYGTENADIQFEIVRYSQKNEYEAVRFSQATCTCGGILFSLESDEHEGVAKRICATCGTESFMGDSAEYAAEAALESHICVCNYAYFAIMSGVALYPESDDVRWYYIGCRCASCQLVGVFADWKSESGNAVAFLAKT